MSKETTKGLTNRSKPLSPLSTGPLPADWRVDAIGSVSHKVTNGFVGSSVPNQVDEGGIAYLQGFNIRPSKIELVKRTFISEKFHRSQPKSQLKAGDVLVVQSGHIGTAARVPDNFGEANCHALIIVDLDREQVVPDYLVEHLNSSVGRARMRGLHVGSSMLHINTSELAQYRLPIPPLPEQQKIAAILSTWDEAIEKLTKLIAAKRRRKQGLMQRLLTGKHLLPPGTEDGEYHFMRNPIGALAPGWRSVPLSKLFVRVQRQNDSTPKPVLTISAKSGFLHQEAKFSKVIAGRNIEQYTLLYQGEFAYNKGNSYTYPQGCVYRLTGHDQAAVPNVYFCFRITDKADPAFFESYFEAGLINRQLQRVINTGVRNNGLLNLSAKDFFASKVHLPTIDQQWEIGALFKEMGTEIDFLEGQLKALQTQKRGLMQKLLTGQWRVAVEGS